MILPTLIILPLVCMAQLLPALANDVFDLKIIIRKMDRRMDQYEMMMQEQVQINERQSEMISSLQNRNEYLEHELASLQSTMQSQGQSGTCSS